MSGEGFALLAAFCYGLAGVTIVKGKVTARGDNGVFLSVLVTASLTGGLWLGRGEIPASALAHPENRKAIAIFAMAGLLSTVLGRTTMYRATEQIGPVATSLLRRLTPVFAVPLAMVLLAEFPNGQMLLGAGLVLAAILLYLGSPVQSLVASQRLGWLLGVGSAAFYAASYTLRSYGLDWLPDAALGTCIGALAGVLWFVLAAALRKDRTTRLCQLIVDRGRWHWITAIALSAGQTLQFFALKSASVVAVATLGALEVFFTVALAALFFGEKQSIKARFLGAAGLAVVGTALLVW